MADISNDPFKKLEILDDVITTVSTLSFRLCNISSTISFFIKGAHKYILFLEFSTKL